jgi:hypothetical protein
VKILQTGLDYKQQVKKVSKDSISIQDFHLKGAIP